MFKANQPNAYIPSKSIAIKPEVVSDVSGGNQQIRINIPSFVGFVDPNQTYFKANLQMTNARGQLVPDPNGGVHSLFRDVLYRDGNNSTTLERNDDYNANTCLLSHFSKTPSLQHKHELFSGVQNAIGDDHDEQTLYYAQRTIAGGTDGANPDRSRRVANKIKVETQLNSGIWTQGNIIPVSAMNGMKVVLDTEDVLRSCMYTDLTGSEATSSTANSFYTMTSANLAIGSNVRANAPNYNIEVNCPVAQNPWAVFDKLYVRDAGSAVGDASEELLGVIVGFSNNGGNLRITYVPQVDGGTTILHNLGSLVYYKHADRQIAHTFFVEADQAGAVATGSVPAPSFTFSDIEMIVQSCSPPDAYVSGMLKASQSEKGISFDILTYELHRHNQANTTGLLQAQIPTLMKRAKSLFSQPLSVTHARSVEHSSLSGVVDNAVSYEWIHGTDHYPSRQVPLNRYSTDYGSGTFGCEPLHLSELQKAIVNVNKRVLNLQLIKQHFCVARGLTKYGQVMDLSPQTLSLRVDYQGGTEQKLFNTYVYGLRRIQISQGQVMAMM